MLSTTTYYAGSNPASITTKMPPLSTQCLRAFLFKNYIVNFVFLDSRKWAYKNIMRAKFQTASVTDFGYGSKQVKLSAVYSGDKNDEDNQFSQATPSGSIEMMVTKAGAQDFIKPGKKYYVDFTECED